MVWGPRRVRAIIIVTCLFLVVPACNRARPEETVNPYDRLCVIYEEEMADKKSPGPAAFQRLSNRLDDELPELEEEFSHLANLSKEDFYPTLKILAERYTGEVWECSFIKRYYKL